MQGQHHFLKKVIKLQKEAHYAAMSGIKWKIYLFMFVF